MIVLYILLLLASFFFYIQFEGPFSFYLFFFVAAYPVVFSALTFAAKRKLHITFNASDFTAPKGNSVPVSIVIDNKSHIPVPNCEITLRYKAEISDSWKQFKIHSPVFPNNTQVLTVRLSYKHYGSLNVEIKKIRIFDILRIIRMRPNLKSSVTQARLVVFPDHIPIEKEVNNYSELGLESDSYSKVKKGDDPSEIFDIHNYNEGDKISRIHWKLSAKQDDMMVKDYSLPIVNGILLAIDLTGLSMSGRELDSLDAIIDAFSAVSLHLAEGENMHTVLWSSPGTDGCERFSVSNFEDYTTVIKRLILNGIKPCTHSAADAIASLSSGIVKYAHLIYFTNGLTEEDKAKLTESGYAYRYTVLDAGLISEAQGYRDGSFSVIPLIHNAVAGSLEELEI